jgi:NADH-quinone oxidoreductase subunit B
MSVTELNLACCAVEAAEGVDLWRANPVFAASAQAVEPALNVLVVAGTVTKANADLVRRSYENLPTPRAVIAFGVCTISGGPYWDSYSVVPGIAEIVPVDIMVAGCPPQPADVAQALNALAVRVTA